MFRRFRHLLYPFSLFYGAGVWIRNKLYDRNVLRSADFNFPVICIGNLSLGGTGKTPMTEYLIRILQGRFQIAVLSRGYKRKTKGFVLAGPETGPLEIGDEPMQIHKKFPTISVAVAEERIMGIPFLLQARPNTEVILLDDAFQHREVRSGLNILLTEYHHLYTREMLLPAGNLRDSRSSSKRAHLIVITKCPHDLGNDEREALIREINPQAHQKVLFTKTEYGVPYHLFTGEKYVSDVEKTVLLVCGIANPQPLKQMLEASAHHCEVLSFGDHHIFNLDDLKEVNSRFERLEGKNKIILTTEKDAVRLAKFEKKMAPLPVFVMPVEHQFLFGAANAFEQKILQYIARARVTLPIVKEGFSPI